MRSKLINAVVVLGLILSTPMLVVAQDNSDAAPKQEQRQSLEDRVKEAREEFQVKLEEAKKLRVESRCEAVKTKAAQVRTRAQSFQQNHEGVYNTWRTRLTGLVEKVEEAGADTTQLKTDLATFDQMLEDAKTEFTAYASSLGSVDELSCADGQVFYDGLQDARTYRQVLAETLQELRTFVNETIKADLLAIKDELTAATDTVGEEGA